MFPCLVYRPDRVQRLLCTWNHENKPRQQPYKHPDTTEVSLDKSQLCSRTTSSPSSIAAGANPILPFPDISSSPEPKTELIEAGSAFQCQKLYQIFSNTWLGGRVLYARQSRWGEGNLDSVLRLQQNPQTLKCHTLCPRDHGTPLPSKAHRLMSMVDRLGFATIVEVSL